MTFMIDRSNRRYDPQNSIHEESNEQPKYTAVF